MPNLRDILYDYTQLRRDDQARRDRLRDELMQDEVYARLEEQALALHRARTRAALNGSAAQPIREELEQVRRTQKERMAQLGHEPNALDPVWCCPLCKDTGYVSGHLCRCVLEKLPANDKNVLPGPVADQTFENFRADIFDGSEAVRGELTQRDCMLRSCKLCKQYADRFPHNEKPNVILTGQTGLGKSYLLNCIAHRVAEQGYKVALLTAYDLQNRIMAGLRKEGDVLAPLIECDLLCLDDLGCESDIRNIWLEKLLILVNERVRLHRPIAVATNLTPIQLGERYGDRIASRLRDQTMTMVVPFAGRDVRLTRR